MYLFFDTETTNLADTKRAPDREPVRVCQFAAILCNHDRRIMGQFKALVKPEGWTVDPATAKFHGITTEICQQYGVKMGGVLVLFDKFCKMADVHVAFNNSYDLHMLEIETHHHARYVELPKRGDCAMQMAKPVLKLPATERMKAAGFNDYKPPNLKEAHKAFFGEDLDGAHDALADVKATMRCYFHMIDLQKQAA